MIDYPRGQSEEVSLSLDMHALQQQYRTLIKLQANLVNESREKNVGEIENLEGLIGMCEYVFDVYPPKTEEDND